MRRGDIKTHEDTVATITSVTNSMSHSLSLSLDPPSSSFLITSVRLIFFFQALNITLIATTFSFYLKENLLSSIISSYGDLFVSTNVVYIYDVSHISLLLFKCLSYPKSWSPCPISLPSYLVHLFTFDINLVTLTSHVSLYFRGNNTVEMSGVVCLVVFFFVQIQPR